MIVAAQRAPPRPSDVPPSAGSETAVRRAALLLHALPNLDREWMIAQLPEGQRAILQALLGELQALGIPPERRLLDEALAASGDAPPQHIGAAPTAEAGRPRMEAIATSLELAEPGRLVTLLREEPAMLIARLLQARAWPWRRPVLQRLGAVKRMQVERHLVMLAEEAKSAGAGQRGAALEDALIQALARRLDEGREQRAGDRTGASALLRWLRQLGGRP